MEAPSNSDIEQQTYMKQLSSSLLIRSSNGSCMRLRPRAKEARLLAAG